MEATLRLDVAGDADPVLLIKVRGQKRFDTQPERLGGWIAKHPLGCRVPKRYAPGFRVRDNDCVGYPLENVADAEFL